MKFLRRCATGGLTGAALIAGAAPAADQYPSKSVRMIVPYPPGGGSDLTGRAMGQKLSEALVSPEMKERFASLTLDATPGPPEEFRKLLESEVQRWKEVLKQVTVQLD